MMASVILGLWNAKTFESIRIENIDLESKVELLKKQASEKFEKQNTAIDLLYCGYLLDENQPLSNYGVSNGSVIHIVNKPQPKITPETPQLSPEKISRVVSEFKRLKVSNRLHPFITGLSKSEHKEKLLTAFPALHDDPVALTIILEYDLASQFANHSHATHIAEQHPLVAVIFEYALANLQTSVETAPAASTDQPSTSYSFLGLSDDDDDEMDPDSEGYRPQYPVARNTSFNAITAAQLAAAISNATNTAFNSTEVPTTPPVSGNVITNEMFSNAIQQAFTSAEATENVQSAFETLVRRYRSQLDQMAEMGLTNVGVNVRALEASAGDVQSAVELVFNGVID